MNLINDFIKIIGTSIVAILVGGLGWTLGRKSGKQEIENKQNKNTLEGVKNVQKIEKDICDLSDDELNNKL